MAIGDDFKFYPYEDQFRLVHESGTTVYTLNAGYSWRKEEEENLWLMSFEDSMTAATDYDYEMAHSAFISNNDVKYFKTGTLTTSEWDGGTYARGIRVLQFGDTYTSAVSTDIGKGVTQAVTNDTGTLMWYDNTLKRWWVRQDALDDVFDDTTNTVSVDGGTGTGNLRKDGYSGEETWNNVYTIFLTTATTPLPWVYIVQDRAVITNDADGNDWWSRGDIDILVKVKEGGVEIDAAALKFFARQANDEFSAYNVDLTGTGGQTPIVLATKADIYATKPEWYLLYDAEAGGGFSVGDVVDGATSGAQAEVITLTDWGTEGCLGLGNVIGTFQNDENLQVSASTKGVANGTVGDVYVLYDDEVGGGFTVGDTVTGNTSNATGTLRGLQDDVSTGKLVIEMSGSGQYYDYEDDEELRVTGTKRGLANGDSTRSVAGFSDIRIQYIHGTLPYDTGVGGLPTVGATLTGTTSSATAVIMAYTGDATSGTLTLANMVGSFQNNEDITDTGTFDADVNDIDGLTPARTMDYAFEQQSAYPYGVFVYCATRPIIDAYMYLQYRLRSGQTATLNSWTAGVRVLKTAAAHGCVEEDIGKTALGATTGDQGYLLSYTSDTMTVLLYDPADTGDLFDEVEVVNITGGTGSGTTTGCSSLVPMEGRQYQIAYQNFDPDAPGPLGHMAGTDMFGPRSVMYTDMATADAQNFTVLDDNNAKRDPPNYQILEATGCVATEYIILWRGDGSGNIDKTLYQSDATVNLQGDSDVVVQTAISTDTTPGTGTEDGILHVRDNTRQYEYRIRYASWVTSTFTFVTKITGSTTSGGGKDTINDSGASFLSEDIQYGDIVRNTTDGSWAQVEEVVSDIEITTTFLQGGTGNTWDNLDGYEFHTLPYTIDGSDYVFPAYLNKIVAAATEGLSLIHPGVTRQLILEYRDKYLKVFRQPADWPSTGASVPVVRNPDNIVS